MRSVVMSDGGSKAQLESVFVPLLVPLYVVGLFGTRS